MSQVPVRTASVIVTSAILSAVSASPVDAAEAYSSKPVRLIVPTAPGGSTDVVARITGSLLGERLGTQVVVDNRGGASGAIALETAARAAPDGHTLLIVSASHTSLAALQKLPADPVSSFMPIAKIASVYLALVVHPTVEAASVQELIALAKRKPGALNFSGSGPAAHVTMAAHLFKQMAGIDFVIVEYKSGGPAVIDLIGGHTQAMLASIPSVLPHIKAGKLRVLGTSGTERSTFLPDAPTIDKAGVPGESTVQWHGIVAPLGTPQRTIDRLHAELKALLFSDDGRKKLVASGSEIDYLPPAELGKFMRQDKELWAQLIRKAKITVRD